MHCSSDIVQNGNVQPHSCMILLFLFIYHSDCFFFTSSYLLNAVGSMNGNETGEGICCPRETGKNKQLLQVLQVGRTAHH